MSSCSYKMNFVTNQAVNQKPIWFDVTLSMVRIITAQFVVSMFCIKSFFINQLYHDVFSLDIFFPRFSASLESLLNCVVRTGFSIRFRDRQIVH